MSYIAPTMEVPVPSVEDLNLDQYCPSNSTFLTLLAERQILKAKCDTLEKRIAEIDKDLGIALDLSGQKRVVWNKQYMVIRREPSKAKETLDKDKAIVLMVEAGITPEQIREITKVGEPGKAGVTVRRLSENQTEGSQESLPGRDTTSPTVLSATE